MYKVVGWRKEYYERCERELRERQERLLKFLKEKFGIDREDVVSYNTSVPEVKIKNAEKYLHLKERKDVRLKLRRNMLDLLRGKESYEGELRPDRRTKEGKALAEEWEKVLAGDFGLIFHPTHPFFLRVSPWNCRKEDESYISGRVSAIVKEIDGELILVDWEGFDPERLEGFEKVEVKV